MTSNFQVGLNLPFESQDYRESALLIEELGFDYLGSGEHLLFHGPVPNAFSLLSFAAGVTSKIKLVSTITLVPLYPPVLLTKLASMLDIVSNGRFELGIGVGGEYQAEFNSVNVPVTERGERTNECLSILNKLWTGEVTSHTGKHWNFENVALQPKPFTQPSLRIWVAGRGVAAMKRAAIHGDVWMPYMYTPDQFHESLNKIEELSQESGRDKSRIFGSVNCFINVSNDRTEAIRVAAQQVGELYNQDFSGTRARYLVAGNVEDCVSKIREYAQAGARSAILTLACPRNEWEAMAKLVGAEVLPQLQRL